MVLLTEPVEEHVIQQPEPKKSDWVDSLHAMYAPYVDIFRTDSYMAPIVEAKVEKYGTTVVAKIGNLAEKIETRLSLHR